MKTNIGSWIGLILLAHVLVPSLLHSQAIRQLELLTGQTIDRGYSSGNYDYSSSAPSTLPSMDYYNGEFGSFLAEQSFKESEKGVKAYNKKKWASAVKHFKKATKFDPGNSVSASNLANAKTQLAIEKEKNKKPDNPYKKTDDLFLSNINKDIEAYGNQVKWVRKSIAGYVPPLPPAGAPRRVVADGLMMGLYSTEFDFWLDSQRPDNPFTGSGKVTNPFTNKEFKEGEYFAGTDKKTNSELVRGFLDNAFLGKFTLNTEYGKELVNRLNGTHFNRLIAHSNGATVSEALIRENVITVDELHVMGGDRSVMNFSGYDDLVKTGKVKKIVVWINPGDLIPCGTSALPLAGKITDTGRYQSNMTAFFDYRLKGQGNTNPNVEYRILQGASYQKGQKMEFNSKIFEAHELKVYFENVQRYLAEKQRIN
jgi:hypothetical protein